MQRWQTGLSHLSLRLIKVNGLWPAITKEYFCDINFLMKKLRWLTILMGITLLGITGFQAYWLKNNYDREKKTMQIKANVAFQETVKRLQIEKLKLEDPFADTGRKDTMKLFVKENSSNETEMSVKILPRKEVITMVDAMRDKLMDSLKMGKVNSAVIISMTHDSMIYSKDSAPIKFERRLEKDHIVQFLYGVDSLQDSLKVQEISLAYQKKLNGEKLSIPFTVQRTDFNGRKADSLTENETQDFSDVTVGFVHPVTYRLELGNTFGFLIKKITMPILFSVFLVGITILSFVLLYRSLLKQQRLAEIKNEFISNITHELKTPIATVGVAIEALRNFNAIHDPEKTKEYLDISKNELQRLSLLVDKVLKLSMFEKKEMELKKEQFDCGQLVKEVMNSMKLQFEKYHAQVNLQTEGENFLVEADKLHITSVVYNLLDNALKYSKENPVIDVQLKSHPEYIELVVSDNGIGIEPAYKEKIFDKFFRVPSGNKHNIKGYGLGLSYVAEVIKRHQGHVHVETELNKGSIFTATFPYKEVGAV